MLQPKKTKYRKVHNIYPDKKKAQKGAKISFGEFGLKSLEPNWLTSRQIEAARIAITRRMGREGKVFIRVFPHVTKTSKPIGVRMGKGKGNPDKWVAIVHENTIMFETTGVSATIAKDALRLGGNKLPVKFKILAKGEE